MVELDGDHHAVGHAFAADVAVADVGDIGHVVADGNINGFVCGIAVKELLEGEVDLGVCGGFGLIEKVGEEVAHVCPDDTRSDKEDSEEQGKPWNHLGGGGRPDRQRAGVAVGTTAATLDYKSESGRCTREARAW